MSKGCAFGHEKPEPCYSCVARLEVAIAAKDAALEEHGCDFVYPSSARQPRPCPEQWGDDKEQWCSTCAALSPDAGKGHLPPEAKVLLKDISDAWLGSATPQEFWDKFSEDGDDLWGRVAQFIAPSSLDVLKEGA